MGNLKNDLDRFLKTDGIRILIESGVVRGEPWEPLTVDDIDDFFAMNLEDLDTARLEDLQKKAEDLLDELEDAEPGGENSEEYETWEERVEETERLIRRIRDRLDELEEEDEEAGPSPDPTPH